MNCIYTEKPHKLFTVAVVLFPILNSSHVGNLNFGYGDLLLVFVFVAKILPNILASKLVLEEKKFWVFMGYLGLVSIVECVVTPSYSILSMLVPYMKYVFYGIIIFGCMKYFDTGYGIKFYINVCVMESVYSFIQYILTVITGIALPYVFPFSNMEYGINGALYNAQLLQTLNVEGIRGVGFFPEPSHFAEYTIFSIVFLLFKERKNRIDIIKFIIISFGILLTKSSIGIISWVIAVLFYYFYSMKQVSKKHFVRIVFTLVMLIAIFVSLGIKFDVFSFIMQRLETINERTWAVSGNLRLLRGFIIYGETPWFIKVFGIGCGNYSNFVDTYNIQTFFDRVMSRTNEYMNGVSTILLRSGVIGGFLYINFCCTLFKNLTKAQRVIFWMGIIILCTEYFFFAPIFVMYLCFLNTPMVNAENSVRNG